MEKTIFRIYRTPEGKEPYTDWEKKLPKPLQIVLMTRLSRVQNGNFGDTKRISGSKGIYELRIHLGPGYRIYFAKDGDTIILLLCGGMKKSQERDIEKAKAFLKDYFEREQ